MLSKYLSDKYIARLDKFNLRARLIVEGFIIGLHKSPYHGFSVEFSDHRQYNPGDDIKNLDWKVYGRTGKYYIKRYEEETNLKSYIILDHSKSMGYKSGKISKLEYSKALASALSYLMISQQDAVGLLSFTDHLTDYLPPRSMRTYLNLIHEKLYNLKPDDETNTSKVLHNLAEKVRKRGLIILISDLLDDPDEILQGLMHFRHQKHEVIVFHLQDLYESTFPFKRETQFIDAETNEKVKVSPWQIKQDYLESLERHRKYLKNKCYEYQIEFNSITTNTPFEESLLQYLIKRSKLY